MDAKGRLGRQRHQAAKILAFFFLHPLSFPLFLRMKGLQHQEPLTRPWATAGYRLAGTAWISCLDKSDDGER